jgi:hypothetical protein
MLAHPKGFGQARGGHNVHLSRSGRLNCTFCREDEQNVLFKPGTVLRCTFPRDRRFQED